MASDIDFDELDKAVNSLLGSKDDASTSQSADNSQTNSPMAPVTPAPASSVPATPPAARRGNGRFMDIRPTNRPASIASTPVTPVNTTVQPAVDTTPQSNETEAPSANDWPDPIDFMADKAPDNATDESPKLDEPKPELHDDEDQQPEAQPSDAPPSVDLSDVDEGELSPVDSPATTPFLPGTKVEKRPLGSFASPMSSGSSSDELMDHRDEVKFDMPTPTPASPVTPAVSDTPAAASVDTPSSADAGLAVDTPTTPVVDDTTPMPAELQSDVLSLESDEVKVPSAPAAVTATPNTVTAAGSDSAPTSIVQQYKEKLATAAPASGAIYDTESYHKPLTPKKKPSKKHGWMIVLWIFLLIVLGAGAGVAIYYFVLPLLG